jgi:hypothetical protein
MNGMERQTIRSAGLFRWISTNQADIGSEYDHGWWSSMEFLQLLSHDFTDFEFDVISLFLMTTPPPSSTLPMPLVSARSTSLQIVFKEDWVMEPFYTVTVHVGFPEEVILLGILEPIDPENKWLLQNFPCAQLYEPYQGGASAFSGSVRNQHLLYALFQILAFQAKARTDLRETRSPRQVLEDGS